MQSWSMDLCYQFVRSVIPGEQVLKGKRSEVRKEGKPIGGCVI